MLQPSMDIRCREGIRSHIWTALTNIKNKTLGAIKTKGKKVIVEAVANEVRKIPIIGGPISKFIEEKYSDDTEIEVEAIEDFLVELRDSEEDRFEFLVSRLEVMSEDMGSYHDEITETLELMMGGIDENYEDLSDFLSKRFADIGDEVRAVGKKVASLDAKWQERFDELESKLLAKFEDLKDRMEVNDREAAIEYVQKEKEGIELAKSKFGEGIDPEKKIVVTAQDRRFKKSMEDAAKVYSEKYGETPDAELYVTLGNMSHFDADYDEALGYFDKALELDPKDANACYNKGLALYNLERYDEALGYFDKALELDPKDANACYSTGVCLQRLNRNKEAEKCLGMAEEYRI